MRINWSRWRYRRMAWKNDPVLFMDMHPQIAKLVDDLYKPSRPIGEWSSNMMNAARRRMKIEAIHQITGEDRLLIDVNDYDGDAAEVYAWGARLHGWTG